MKTLDEAQQLLTGMSRAEKAQLLRWAVQDLGDAYPGIEEKGLRRTAERPAAISGH